MEHLHENGVVHGDLKSLNILVAEPEQALLTDFGFFYVTDDNGLQGPTLSSSHALGSTRAYEAPERLEDPESRRTTKSDVFAFGMVCYEVAPYLCLQLEAYVPYSCLPIRLLPT
ncbi:Interleukin-1 receptor-associated kinase 4 [Termitomyces sp. J132]|nr:Interleukin-1 receptor-associated kinase 4 [Termitomyces sp. J132]